ncbi:DEAD/DEAH box helicase [Marinagarivorans cellulosilyticus]|uniref:DEAD-box ATP-dependent RNA helicase RhpA n=1 Tax=Marinagarivorans cellulosilyticus TaxID=2721545 RepID=A0AAN2BKV6_9GAMM|nr:DEAD/DEAH box helicase [Marinagarivorans cellulosilyticus]BCD98372.1 hypothetical protein MARGE09_P2573 [Marinagarivorans cellulosilyticus]
MTFATMALSPALLQAISEKGYLSPTAIQAQAIPAILTGADVVATAQTGTGKTASFVLPLLQMLSNETTEGTRTRRPKRFRALIISPTRELALQIEDNIHQYSRHLDIRATAMVGGMTYQQQKQKLIEGIDILVATPGRLLDMANQRALHFDEVKTLVLDEADRMLDMGFIDDIHKILNKLPKQRQTLLFSATLPKAIRKLANSEIHNPIEITIDPQKAAAPKIEQWLVAIDKHNKSALLSHLIKEQHWTQALIFIRTQHGAAKLVSQLEKRGIAAEAIHGGRSQASRSQILADFKTGKIQFLVATGVAARGIDINELSRVVNYDLPDDTDDYIHRIGRTGRAGLKGEGISLVSKDDFKRLCAIERRLNKIITRKEIDGFSVTKGLPPSNLNFTLKSVQKSPYSASEENLAAKAAKKPTPIKASKEAPKSAANVWAQWVDKNKG